jgi:hypothetical protein
MGETRDTAFGAARPEDEFGLYFRRHLPARGTGAALVMPAVSIEAMNKHLAEISQCVSLGAIALLILDGAGWHGSPRLAVPENIVLPLPPYAPELNSVDPSTGSGHMDYLRSTFLSHCVWDTCEAILDACCDAWNALIAKSGITASIGTREYQTNLYRRRNRS